MTSYTYDAPHISMDCGQKLAPVSQQLEHSNFSSQEALSSHYRGLLNAQHGLMSAVGFIALVEGRLSPVQAVDDHHVRSNSKGGPFHLAQTANLLQG